ncbi:MAG: hypothetical protein AMXMBFR20_19130 [Planctomycetia bacterium]
MSEKKVRVHNLAKELSVKSQTIIEKCRAEGIEIKNHMHVVSAGLEATIREWFTPGLHASAIEDSKPVDIKAVTVKPKRSTKKTESSDRDSDSQSGVAVMEPPTEDVPAPPAETKPAAKVAKEETVVEQPTVVTKEAPPQEDAAPPVTPEEPDVAAPPAELAPAAQQTEAKPPVVPNVAGPQNVPQPAKLSGPKLIRIDKPDEVHRPRPTYRPPPRPPAGGSAPVRGLTAEEEESRRRGRGPVVRGKEGARAGDAADARANPRRSIRDTREDVNEKLREWRDRDLIERKDRLAHASGRGIGGLKAIEGKHSTRRTVGRTAQTHVRKDKVELTEPIIVKDFSRETGIPVAEIVKRLIQEHGQLANINSAIATEVAQLMALEVGIELEVAQARSATEVLRDEFAALERKKLVTRPPVVTVLGHVDHGKTSLLDRIRNAKVAAGEAGGITQHIGAYRAKVDDKYVAFLDTPGHAAFTAMRARGAHMTDVVVLVVAADDGVMPTTIEAINHAKAANTTIVVALNKIDLPHDINKIYGQLTEHGLTPSGDWGGDIDVVKTSASTGEGIDELLAHLATLSDVLDLKADPTIPATGSVIEAERDGGQGNLAHLLVQEGTLKTGDIIVCGPAFGRVRSIRDDRAKVLKSAGPSTPVEVTGLSDIPRAGDRFYVVNDLQRAKEIAADEAMRRRESQLLRTAKPTNLESLLAGAEDGRVPTLPVIIRADVQGSVDVLRKTLAEFPTDQVRLEVLHAGVGTVTESDLILAQASKAIILAFYVVPEPAVQKMADGLGVDIRSYRVIYNVLDDIKKALEGLLTPDEKIESRGRAEVREVFNISKVGKIAGCFVRDGVIQRSNMARVIRDGVVIRDKSAIESLRRFKDDAKEVKNGFECGIRIAGFDDLKPGDIIETFEVIKVARKL